MRKHRIEMHSARKRTMRHIQRNSVTEPRIIKKTFDLHMEPESTAATHSMNNTTLDRILNRMRTRKWPKDIVLLITPSSRHPTQYKLHIIDRKRNEHLGVTSITKGELMEIKTSKAYHRFNIIFGTKCIDLKTVALQTELIGELMDSLNCNCCSNKCMKEPPVVESERFEIDNASTSNSEPLSVRPRLVDIDHRRSPLHTQLTEAEQLKREQEVLVAKQKAYEQQAYEQKAYEQQCLDYKLNKATVTDAQMLALIDRINNAFEPSAKDLDKFFALAERYNFKMFVRPELYWRTSLNATSTKGQEHLVRFTVECFMHFDNYVGSISLYSEQLQQRLRKHATLLPRVSVISDVFELTPIPKVLVTVLRTLFRWLCMEIVYDAIGELIFNSFKQFT